MDCGQQIHQIKLFLLLTILTVETPFQERLHPPPRLLVPIKRSPNWSSDFGDIVIQYLQEIKRYVTSTSTSLAKLYFNVADEAILFFNYYHGFRDTV